MSGYWSRDKRRARKLQNVGTALVVIGAVLVIVSIVAGISYAFGLMGDPRSMWIWGLR